MWREINRVISVRQGIPLHHQDDGMDYRLTVSVCSKSAGQPCPSCDMSHPVIGLAKVHLEAVHRDRPEAKRLASPRLLGEVAASFSSSRVSFLSDFKQIGSAGGFYQFKVFPHHRCR